MNYSNKKTGRGIYLFLGITALVCFLLASGVFPFLVKDGTGIPSPDVMLCFVCALPAFVDVKKGAIYALCLGFAADLFINPPTAFSPLVFLGCMCLANFLQKYFSRVGTLAVAISTLPCIALKLLVSCVVSLFTVDGISLGNVLSGLSYMSFIVDFATAIILCFVMRVLCRKFGLRKNN